MYYVLIYGLCLNQSWDIHSIKYLAAVCMDLEPCLFILLDKKKQVAKSGTWRDLIFVNMF